MQKSCIGKSIYVLLPAEYNPPHLRTYALHELGSHIECNDTLHGSELGPHWVLGPKNSKFGPMGPKNFAQKFLYTKLVKYHVAILLGFEGKIVFWA